MHSGTGTVADLVLYLLDNYDPLAHVEVLELVIDVPQKVRVHLAGSDNEGGEAKKEVNKLIFTDDELYGPEEASEGDLVYLDYLNPNSGPTTRVGYVLPEDNNKRGDSLLLYDLSVNGVRRFDFDYIDNIHQLS